MKLLIWDFDGTLGYREGGMWTASLFNILCRHAPDCGVTQDQLNPYMLSGMPWHTPERPHPEIRSPDQWWSTYEPNFDRAFKGVGVDTSLARLMAKEMRRVYPDPERFRLFSDTVPTLDQLSCQGWTHVVLSNHVPELPDIIRHLGLDLHVAAVFNSAETGYEKPHPKAFRIVLDRFSEATKTWMIGDSMNADIAGADAMGIPGILVRKYHEDARDYCDTLAQVPAIVDSS